MSISQAKHPQGSETQGASYVSVNTELSDGQGHDDSDPMLPGWPREPLSLQGGTTASLVTIVKDCLMLVFPLLFLVLAVLAYQLDDQKLSTYGSNVEAAAKLGPTVFPIAFAAIASKSIRSLARKLVERGETIGVLEQLLGSQSLAGTLTRLTELRHVHVLGISVVAVWALSPLGGQSALRLLSVQRFEAVNSQIIAYNNLGDSVSSWIPLTAGTLGSLPAMTAFYSAALLGAEKNQNESADLWGNPKVPLLESLNQENDGWRTVANKTGLQYSSLVGTRLQGLCRDCNMTFSMENLYSNFSCRKAIHNIPLNQTMAYIGLPYAGWLPRNTTDPFSGLSYGAGGERPISSFLITNHVRVPDHSEKDGIPTILYVTEGSFDGIIAASIYNCTMETTRVESIVSCQEGKCGVTRMRRSRSDKTPSNWTLFYLYSGSMSLFSWFPFASGYTRSYQASATDNFIYGDTVPFNYTSPRDWRTISDSDVSKRLTMIFNSILQTSQAPYSITNGNTFQPLRCTESVTPGSSTPRGWVTIDDCINMKFTTAKVTRGEDRYKASLGWISLLVVSSVVLLLLGISTIVLHCITSAPDVLGYVSSMTRDNPYVDIPAGGSTLDGPSRARALRDVRVRLTDVRGHDEVGYIALTTSEGDEVNMNVKYERNSRLYS